MNQQKTTQVLKQIFDMYGVEIAKKQNSFKAAVFDLLDEKKYKDERVVLKYAIESGAISILLSSTQITASQAQKAVKEIQKDCHMVAEDAEFVVGCIVAACGFNPAIVTENVREGQETEVQAIQKSEPKTGKQASKENEPKTGKQASKENEPKTGKQAPKENEPKTGKQAPKENEPKTGKQAPKENEPKTDVKVHQKKIQKKKKWKKIGGAGIIGAAVVFLVVAGIVLSDNSIGTNESNSDTSHTFAYEGSNNETSHTFAYEGSNSETSHTFAYEGSSSETDRILTSEETGEVGSGFAETSEDSTSQNVPGIGMVMDKYNKPQFLFQKYDGYVWFIQYRGNDSSVRIPSEIDGLPVTRIDDNAFKDCLEVTSVTMPDSITEIGDHAFSGCKNLVNIELSENITEIGEMAFVNCSSLTEVYIPDGVTVIKGGTFGDCSSLKSVWLPNTVTEIWGEAFANCSSLERIWLNDSVDIAETAFGGCENLSIIRKTEGIG